MLVLALLEARALLRSFRTGLVPAGRSQMWTVFRYEVATTPGLPILDFGDPAVRGAADATVQELTGDWEGYRLRRLVAIPPALPPVLSRGTFAPTQGLAHDLYSRHAELVGFLAPSALASLVCNLVLFHDRVPAATIAVTGRRTIRL